MEGKIKKLRPLIIKWASSAVLLIFVFVVATVGIVKYSRVKGLSKEKKLNYSTAVMMYSEAVSKSYTYQKSEETEKDLFILGVNNHVEMMEVSMFNNKFKYEKKSSTDEYKYVVLLSFSGINSSKMRYKLMYNVIDSTYVGVISRDELELPFSVETIGNKTTGYVDGDLYKISCEYKDSLYTFEKLNKLSSHNNLYTWNSKENILDTTMEYSVLIRSSQLHISADISGDLLSASVKKDVLNNIYFINNETITVER